MTQKAPKTQGNVNNKNDKGFVNNSNNVNKSSKITKYCLNFFFSMKIFLVLLNTKVAISEDRTNACTEVLLNAGKVLNCYG